MVVGFRRSRETIEFCATESVSASSGVSEETDAGVEFYVALSWGELCLPVWLFLLCLLRQVLFKEREIDPSSLPLSRSAAAVCQVLVLMPRALRSRLQMAVFSISCFLSFIILFMTNLSIYLSELIPPYTPSRSLRSANESFLDVSGPKEWTPRRFGQRAFRYVPVKCPAQ